jgi:hypothetical protein
MEVALFLMGGRGAPEHLRKNKCGTYTDTFTVHKRRKIAIQNSLTFKPSMFKNAFK